MERTTTFNAPPTSACCAAAAPTSEPTAAPSPAEPAAPPLMACSCTHRRTAAVADAGGGRARARADCSCPTARVANPRAKRRRSRVLEAHVCAAPMEPIEQRYKQLKAQLGLTCEEVDVDELLRWMADAVRARRVHAALHAAVLRAARCAHRCVNHSCAALAAHAPALVPRTSASSSSMCARTRRCSCPPCPARSRAPSMSATSPRTPRRS